MTDEDVQRMEAETDRVRKRLKRAHDRGTGVYLDASMVRFLSLTLLQEWWDGVHDEH